VPTRTAGEELRRTIENLSLRTEETSLRAGGSVRGLDSGNPVINIKASSDKFSIGELANVLPALRPYENLQPAFEINARGPADRLDVQVNAREKQVLNALFPLMSRDRQATQAIFEIIKNQPNY